MTTENQDCFSSEEECVKRFQSAKSIDIVADGKVVGKVWEGAPDPMRWTWRCGGSNNSAMTRIETIEKLLDSLDPAIRRMTPEKVKDIRKRFVGRWNF